MKPQVKSQSISEIFGRSYYYIPVYQRRFSWKKKDAEFLYNDVKKLIQNDQDYHFFGHIIIKNSDSYKDKIDTDVFEIIDGQQRLTSIVLFLTAIKRHLRIIEEQISGTEKENERSAVINSINYTINNCTKTPVVEEFYRKFFNPDSPGRLKLQQLDNKIFGDMLRNFDQETRIKSDNKILEVFYHFVDLIEKDLSSRDRVDCKISFLKEIFNKLTTDLYIAVQEVEAKDDAHSIFESLNNRGIPLEQIDLVKNYLVMLLNDELYEKYWLTYDQNEEWGNKSFINSSDTVLADFLYFYTQQFDYIKSENKRSKSRLYLDFVNNIECFETNNNVSKQSALVKIIKDFKNINDSSYMNLYNRVKEKQSPETVSRSHKNKIERRIEVRLQEFIDRLQDLNDAWIVLYWLLANKNQFSTQSVNSEKDFIDIINIIEIYIIRKRIANLEALSNNIFEIIKKMSDSIKNNKNVKKELIKFIYSRNGVKTFSIPTDKDIIKSFIEKAIEKKLAKTILYAIDEENNKNIGEHIRITRAYTNETSPKIHLEHIKSQNSVKNINDDENAFLVDTIGNMLLLPSETNTLIKDWEVFSKNPDEKTKIDEYSKVEIKDKYWLVKDFLLNYQKEEKWRYEEIKKRSAYLADLCIKIWNYEKYVQECLTEEEKVAITVKSNKNNTISKLALLGIDKVYFDNITLFEDDSEIIVVAVGDTFVLTHKNIEYSSLNSFFNEILNDNHKKDYFKKLYIDKKCTQTVESFIEEKISILN